MELFFGKRLNGFLSFICIYLYSFPTEAANSTGRIFLANKYQKLLFKRESMYCTVSGMAFFRRGEGAGVSLPSTKRSFLFEAAGSRIFFNQFSVHTLPFCACFSKSERESFCLCKASP